MTEVIFKAACGGAELSANAYILQVGGCRVLLDAGARQPGASSKNADPSTITSWVERIERPDLCWISHVHWDHIGALGALKSRFPRLRCLASSATRRLGAQVLENPGDRSGGSALASQLQSVASRRYFDMARFCDAGSRLNDNKQAPKFRAMSFPAGHIAGAEMLLIEVEDETPRPFRILYTGDFCGHDQALTPGALFPRTGPDFPIDALVMEGVLATNKAYDGVDYAEQMRGLCELVRGAAGRPVLIGAARLGSAAEVVAGLSGDGIAFTVHQALEPIVRIAFKAGGRDAELAGLDFADERRCEHALAAGKTVVAPGEQFQRRSPAGRLLAGVVGRPEATVVLINRAYPSSVAGKLLAAASDGEKSIRPGRRTVEVRARVARFLLPNHAPRRQLIEAARAVDPARLVLVHGHRSQLFALKRAIEKAGFTGRIDVPRNGEALVLA
jgi:Cft2 family RNA processing exonuclease